MEVAGWGERAERVRLVILHPKWKRRIIVDREELEIATVVFGKMPRIIEVQLEKGIDYGKARL